MDEIFLDMSLPNSGKEESRLKSQGYVEKKYTRSTEKEIEAAFKRYVLKQIIPQRGLTTPAQINALEKELKPLVEERMFEKKPNGGRLFKFKMFVPGAKLLKEREMAEMKNNNSAYSEEELFASNTYGKNLETTRKATELALNVQNTYKKLSKNSKSENIQKALNKTRKAETKLAQMAVNVQNTSEFSTRVKKAQNNAAKTRRNLERLYNTEIKPINNISNILARTHINAYKVSPIMPSGHVARNETFIESILEIKNVRNNRNNKNRNKISSKALVSGLLSSDIRFIRDTVNALISKGMSKQDAIRAGVILANLPEGELKGLQEEAKKANPEFLLQLAQYLASKKL